MSPEVAEQLAAARLKAGCVTAPSTAPSVIGIAPRRHTAPSTATLPSADVSLASTLDPHPKTAKALCADKKTALQDPPVETAPETPPPGDFGAPRAVRPLPPLKHLSTKADAPASQIVESEFKVEQYLVPPGDLTGDTTDTTRSATRSSPAKALSNSDQRTPLQLP